MQSTQEKQRCTRCHRAKALEAFRRQSQRPNGRDTICKACRNAHDREVKKQSFGPLPKPEGSDEWLKEVWRRAALIRKERQER